MTDWHDRASELMYSGATDMAVARKLQPICFPQESISPVYERVHSYLRRVRAREVVPVVPAEFRKEISVVSILKTGTTIEQLAEKLSVSKRVAKAQIDDLIEQGMCIDEANGVYKLTNVPHSEPQTYDCQWSGDKIIRFGVVSDNHFGSFYTQIGHLHEAYDTFKSEGISLVFNPGDLSEGEKMRPGHEYECYVHGADAHVDEIVKNYPRREGILTKYILGNHDLSFIKHIGMDISRQIDDRRRDMSCLGQERAFVDLTPNCRLDLSHPSGGSAYALSYKIQKMIDAMSGGEKPQILIVGHLHKCEYLFYRNIHCLQAGTTQAQSGFMQRMGLAAHMGYWIVEARVNDSGQINRFKPEWFPFYRAIKDDWKNYR